MDANATFASGHRQLASLRPYGTVRRGPHGAVWLAQSDNRRALTAAAGLLAVYYAFRGVGPLALPFLLSATVQPPIIIFIVIYGLDWVATVPATVALCRELFGRDGPIVFGWVFASHQVGAAITATAAGLVRDSTGEYTIAWFGAAGLCMVAAVLSIGISRKKQPALS